jgi:hypothetical protein
LYLSLQSARNGSLAENNWPLGLVGAVLFFQMQTVNVKLHNLNRDNFPVYGRVVGAENMSSAGASCNRLAIESAVSDCPQMAT